MAPSKSAGERENEPTANVEPRRSNRITAAGTNSDRIVETVAKGKVAKTQRHHQAKASQSGRNVEVQEVDQDSSISRGRLSQNTPNASIYSAENASHAPRNSRNNKDKTPRPTSEAKSGALPVSRAAKGAMGIPRGDEGGDSPPLASNRVRINDGNPVPDENLDAADQAQPEDRASASPVEHVSETGA
jgi:hypothetical protein